jgi:RNA polymerase sigma-70 factor, ECF subfamily
MGPIYFPPEGFLLGHWQTEVTSMDRAMAKDDDGPSAPSSLGDQRLASEAATDPVAREVLARRLAPRVRRLSVALLRGAHDAEDATQLALLEILRSAHTFRGESSLEVWADRIAVRTAIRIARKRRLASVRSEAGIEPDDLPGPSPSSSVAESLPRSILAYLEELPEARRTVLVLRHAMGYSIEEIAEYTCTSVNTVKDRLLAARDQVRKMVRRDLATRRRTS